MKPEKTSLRPASANLGAMKPAAGGGHPMLSDGSRQAVAYTPLPEQKAGSSSRRRWLLALAVAAAAVSAGVGVPLALKSAADPVLVVASNDLDRVVTAAARTALTSGQIPELSANPTDAERDGIQDAVERMLPDVTPAIRQRAARVLAHATPPVRKALLDARQAIYRLRVLDNMAQDGDVVWLSLDGVPFGSLLLTNAGTDISIALPVGASAHLLIVAERDGGGGVTFGAASSAGHIRTKVMNVGDREEWTVAVR